MKQKIGEVLVTTVGGVPLVCELWGGVRATRQDGRDYVSLDVECVSRLGGEEHRLGVALVSWELGRAISRAGGH